MGPKPVPLEIRIERFISRSADPDGCWLWTGALCYGYGMIYSNAVHNVIRVHRWIWEREHGPIPNGLLVCHHCDVRRCCNPQHLFLGTNTDNLRDMAAKGRSTYGTKNKGAKLTADQVLEIRALTSYTYQKLADVFGVSRVTIKRIKRRRTWTRI